jgi:CspA family cold shock protein
MSDDNFKAGSSGDAIGIVKWFNAEKGYGFISYENKDYFLHYKDINSNGYKTVNEKDKVRFEPATSPKGLVARNVQAINDW